ncbi:MAG: CoA transferase [Candidatus Bathyarchaeia archaeon]
MHGESQKIFDGYREKMRRSRGPLHGIRVLEVANYILGPGVSMLYADMGAQVIKVEVPWEGDNMRRTPIGGKWWRDSSASFVHMARNKYSLGLDLHVKEGREVFLKLAARSDIVVDNLRPGVMERRFSVGYRQLMEINPRIIYIALNGYGQWGPWAEENRPSFDGVGQAASGLASITRLKGRPPLKNYLYVADILGSLIGWIATLAALYYREKTGKGQFIELSQVETMLRMLDWTWLWVHFTGKNRETTGNVDAAVVPMGVFKTADGYIALAAPAPDEFRGLCMAMDMPELAENPKFSNYLSRLKEENQEELYNIIEGWCEKQPSSHIVKLAEKYGFAAEPVRTVREFYNDEHWLERGHLWDMDSCELGIHRDSTYPVKMSETPPPPPRWGCRPVGLDNEFILTTVLGMSADEIKRLYEVKALGKWIDVPGQRPTPILKQHPEAEWLAHDLEGETHG